jgi:hypothetical protein
VLAALIDVERFFLVGRWMWLFGVGNVGRVSPQAKPHKIKREKIKKMMKRKRKKKKKKRCL